MSVFQPKDLPVIIKEAYFGETASIQNLQKIFSEFRAAVTVLNLNKINSHDKLIEFDRAIEKEFGFGNFCLFINPEMHHNAFTFPVSSKFDTSQYGKNAFKSEGGFKYLKEADYAVMVYMSSAMLLDRRYTDRELFAIILHEIGHSFTAGLSPLHEGFSYIRKVLVAISIIFTIIFSMLNPFMWVNLAIILPNLFNSLTKLNIQTIDKNRSLNKSQIEASTYISSIFGFINGMFTEVFVALALMMSVTKPIIFIVKQIVNTFYSLSIVSALFSTVSFNDERISDNFATLYGYGPDIASGLGKLNKTSGGITVMEVANSVPLLRIWFDLLTLPFSLLLSPFKAHPETIARMGDQADLLQRELNKTDLDPKMRKRIEDDLKEVKEVLNENYFEFEPGIDPHAVDKGLSMFMYKLAGGDIRNMYAKMDLGKLYDDKK